MMINYVLIAACGANGVIGKEGKLPWNIRSEMEYLLKRVAFKPLVMGKNTCLSLKKPINTGKNYVLTTDENFQREGFITVNSMDELLPLLETEEHIIVGGASIYDTFLRMAINNPHHVKCSVELSVISGNYEGDTFFPLELLDGMKRDIIHSHSEQGVLKWHVQSYTRKNTSAQIV